ncbi:Fatty acid desaturase [Richelia intracellularis HM01]|uniref:acyl-CoA desaturase n=1 Tax=Richelia intracellularis TaxID=1164990 RepID=UPI0002B4F64D|nr:fatty acid desaturase [Richelia intracellularis]CCH64734.1 Fatty acid desaturase [Richelia intracellularis HM01]
MTRNLPQLNSVSPRPKVIISTCILHLAVLLVFLPHTFSWNSLCIAVFLHWVTIGLGISFGFHRLATHQSLQAPKWLEYFLILCGTLALQGGVLGWVGYHRAHHLYSDQEKDPHNSNQGFWWSHINWLMHSVPTRKEIPRLTKDIAKDPFYRFCHEYYIELQLFLAIILYLLGGWSFVIWGIFVRLFVGTHSTMFVNSACHMVGYRSYDSEDCSTNCWWVALLTFGEGWHNNHHAFQYSARHGLEWWEIDVTWITIRLLQSLGLVTNVKTIQRE